MATKITHKDLLDGYDYLSADLCTCTSTVRGVAIRWSYRVEREDCCPVCDPDKADTITLQYDRVGRIDFDAELSDHPTNQRITDDIRSVCGDLV